MSAPDPDRPSLTPLRQQPSEIRIVPYSPPRAADSSEDLQPQSGTAAEYSDYGHGDDEDEDDDGYSYGSNWKRSNQSSEKTTASGRPGQGRGALPSTTESRLLLAKREDGVSGDKSATGAGTSGDGPRYNRPTTVAPAGPPPSNVASLAAINALHAPPTRGRLSASSYTTHTSLSSRHSASSHLSDAEPSSSSRASRSPSTGQRRPASSSRRGGFVAVLNEDKTFSLVPQRPRPDPEPEPQPSLDPRSSSALSDYSGPGAGFRSPHLPFYPTTPRVSQASSHEGYTSYASSQYDRPSSAFTSTGTIPDRSITPSTPVPSSPGSSTVHEHFFDDLIAETSSTPPTYRLVGGLRKVPKTPDLKWTHTDHSPSSDATETPLPAVPESSSLGGAPDEDDQPETHPTAPEQASVHSNTPSAGSDPNYVVYEPDSQAPSEAGLSDAAPGQEEGAPADSQLDPDLREQASFDSQQTADTEFESTNIKIYGHSGSEESEEALPEPTIQGGPSEAGSGQFGPPLQTQSSFLSIQSGVSSTSDNTNYRVYGPSSPVLPPVPEAETPQESNQLRPAHSFLSAVSNNSEAANWQIYGRTSPATLASVESFSPPSPSGSYAPLLRSPSPPAGPSRYAQEEEGGRPVTSDNDENYVVHGDPTPDPSPNRSPDASPPGTAVRPSQAGYSQGSSAAEQPQLRRQSSSEGLGYYRSRSRSIENLRPKKSWRSGTSVSSIINEDAEDFFAGQAFLNEPAGQWEPPSVAGPSERQRQLDEQRERERQRAEERASWAEDTEGQAPMALPTTPHQWSSQLSTVMSETEPGSSGGGTRSASLASGSQQGSHGRRSSRGWSSHSRQMLSISSSLAAELENASRSRSDSDPVERPSPVFNPRAGFHGAVRDHDEDGDGLADLQQITPRPSRQRLSDFFASSNSSERNLHSSHSSQSRSSSLNSNSIPAWAKVYYGSGERKFLRNMSISSMSDLGGSRPASAQNSGSPTTDHFPLGIYSPRRRPHEARPDSAAQRLSTAGSMDIEPAPAQEEMGIRRGLRRITSSVWSPHLRRDVRARDRYSVWDPPSVSWSAESGMFGRRNAQVVLFVFGFIFPFAWMIGAVLPLPKPSPLAMLERYSSISDFGVRSREHEFERHIETVDELRYENATWWRTLNRFMSVVGLLIIGAVVGLAVAAVKQGWGRT
ncbi:hypothetical protein Daus18300_008568 [Diaporthe australafricana]|uniref:Serine-rich protein n=1 Tax=Diaporthe australafricana TaxID=127596 RepID=A0ABR3WI12_9PEZI